MSKQMNPVNWFEIPTQDLTRAIAFYEYVFNYTLTQQDMGPLKMAMFPWQQAATGAAGALVQADPYTPSHEGTMVYFHVDDMEATLKRISEKGGKVLREKMGIGEHGFVGHFEDSEGNRVALHSMT